MMSKKIQAEHLGKLYREFSRQKYNKYKHQFPKMRESEIVSKIIHQWDSMDIDAKNKLQQLYEHNRFLIKEEQQDFETKKSADHPKTPKVELAKSEEKPITAKTTPLKDEHPNQQEKVVTVAKFESSELNSIVQSSVAATPRKQTKKISKLGRRDYLTFFKHYFDQFRRQHPKWSQKQITFAIGLLWKRRKLQYKVRTPTKKHDPKPQTATKGRSLFKVQKKLKGVQLVEKWKMLPLQSKNLWNTPSQKSKPGVDHMVGKMSLKSCCPPPSNPLNFLNKQMM